MKHGLIVVLLGAAVALLGAGGAQASCHAQVICQVTVISCDGQSICQSGSNWVQCDGGQKIYCPVCQAQTTCCDGRFIFCNGYTSCQSDPGVSVTCDGMIQGFCPECRSSLETPASPLAPSLGWFPGLAVPALQQATGCAG